MRPGNVERAGLGSTMGKRAAVLRFISLNTVVACLTVGIALGVSNVLINHVHWLGAYLIACPARSWNQNLLPQPAEAITPTTAHAAE